MVLLSKGVDPLADVERNVCDWFSGLIVHCSASDVQINPSEKNAGLWYEPHEIDVVRHQWLAGKQADDLT